MATITSSGISRRAVQYQFGEVPSSGSEVIKNSYFKKLLNVTKFSAGFLAAMIADKYAVLPPFNFESRIQLALQQAGFNLNHYLIFFKWTF